MGSTGMTQMTMTGDGGGEGETYPIRGPPLAPPPAQLLERGNEKMYEINSNDKMPIYVFKFFKTSIKKKIMIECEAYLPSVSNHV